MQKKTIATSLAVLLSSVGLNALDISSAGNIGGATNPTLSIIDSEKVGLNINLPLGGGGNSIRWKSNISTYENSRL